jgi:glucose-6-phosphate dehydrogenase assembly protein OpcA
LANHASSVVVPFLSPDSPVVTWWPGVAPAIPAKDQLGELSNRRITDATNTANPLGSIKSRLQGYTPGDIDLAWSRVTYWRALLASSLDQPPYEPVVSALVSGLKHEPALDIMAGWLANRIGGSVQRAVGPLKATLNRRSEVQRSLTYVMHREFQMAYGPLRSSAGRSLDRLYGLHPPSSSRQLSKR